MKTRSKVVRTGIAIALSGLCGAITSTVGLSIFLCRPGQPCAHLPGWVEIVGLVELVGFEALCLMLGLLVIGFPATCLIWRKVADWWMAPVMMALGSLAIGLVSGSLHIGAIFGAPTGFWWWFFYRRVLFRCAV